MLVECATIIVVPRLLLFEAVVGAQIHDHRVVVELRGEGAGCAMGQGEHNHIVPVQCLGCGVFDDQVGQLGNMRLEGAQWLPATATVCLPMVSSSVLG